MIKVLISQRIIATEFGERLDTLAHSWIPLLEAAGCTGIPIPSSADPDTFIEATGSVGVILSGGNDLSLVSRDPLSALRDKMEARLMETAIRRSMPILGVCRGMQFICTYFGGTLKAVSGHAGTRHKVSGLTDREVNSFHRWCLDAIPTQIVPVAASPDGTTEAIQHTTLPILGIGWHPEREVPFTDADTDLIATHFKEKEPHDT